MSKDELDPDRSRLLDVLLKHSLRAASSSDDQRVAEVMNAIRSEYTSGPQTADLRRQSPTDRLALKDRRWLLLAVTTAAVVTAMLFLSPVLSEKRAYAAVARSLVAEDSPLVRHYAVSLVTDRASDAEQQHDFQLFVKQKSFAVQLQSLIGDGSHWLGGDDHERWIVPRVGPVLTGSNGLLSRWFRKHRKIRTPFLTTSTILKRLQRAYDLTIHSGVMLTSRHPDESEVSCDHIVGLRQQSASFAHIPDRIDLWTNRQTGFAHRVELRWDDPKSAIGITNVMIELVDTPEPAPDFFEHSGHHGVHRRIIRGPAEGQSTVE